MSEKNSKAESIVQPKNLFSIMLIQLCLFFQSKPQIPERFDINQLPQDIKPIELNETLVLELETKKFTNEFAAIFGTTLNIPEKSHDWATKIVNLLTENKNSRDSSTPLVTITSEKHHDVFNDFIRFLTSDIVHVGFKRGLTIKAGDLKDISTSYFKQIIAEIGKTELIETDSGGKINYANPNFTLKIELMNEDGKRKCIIYL